MELGRLLACRAEGLLNVEFPVVLKQFGVLVGLNVQRDHFRGKPGSKFNSLPRDVAPPVDGDDRYRVLAETCRVDRNLAGGEHLHGVVVAADHDEENNRDRDEKQRNPSAFCEFRNQDDDGGDPGDERAQPIDECALQPMWAAIFPPMHDHAGL